MEKKDWVKRELGPTDLRSFKVTLEPAGHTKLKEIPWDQPDYKKRRFKPSSCFTKEEMNQFENLLFKLIEHLKKLEQENRG